MILVSSSASGATSGADGSDAGVGGSAELPRSAAYRQQRRNTSIDMKVLAKIATRAALSVPGVIRHSSGVGQLTGRRLPRITVQMDPAGQAAVADIQIATSWPAPTVAVARATRETVGEWIEHSTGVPVLAVNVDVAAVVPVPDRAVTVDDLAAAPRTPEYLRVTATPLRAVSPTVSRRVSEVSTPVAPRPRHLLHPRPASPVRPVTVATGSPCPVRHIGDTVPREVRHPSVPVPFRAAPLPCPSPPEVAHPETPSPAPVFRPRSPHSPARPRHLAPVIIDHVEVTVPPPARGLPVLYAVPTPRGLPVRDVPTPRGLPVRAVSTPLRSGVTVRPTVRRRRRIPVAVRRRTYDAQRSPSQFGGVRGRRP